MSIFGRALFKVEHLFGLPKTCYTANPAPAAHADVPKTPVIKPTTTVGYNLTIEGDDEWNTAAEQSRIPALQAGVNNYIQSKAFEDFFMNPANAVDLAQTCGLTIPQVIEKMRTAKAHAVIRFYYDRWTTTVGYRNPGENIIYMNRKYHDYYTINDEISNLGHEFAHMIAVNGPLDGFQHSFNPTPQRPYSVNYRINAGVESLS